MTKKLTYIDLFAGAGGLSEGFYRAGCEPVAHVEIDEAASFTLRTRVAYYHLKEEDRLDDYEAYLRGDITRDQLYSLIPSDKLESVINKAIGPSENANIFKSIDKQLKKREVDFIIGGPPCQAYSLVGRARSANGMATDERNYLYLQYFEFLKRYKPKVFVFENVLGLKSAGGGKYFRDMIALFNDAGYEVKDFLFEADRFGVLQKRKRVVLVGYKKKLKLKLPDFAPGPQKEHSVKSIFEDLPPLQAGGGVDKFTRYITEAPGEYLKESFIRNGLDIVTHHVCRPNTEQDKKIYRMAVELWNSKQERLSYETLPEKLKTHKNQTSFFDRFKVVADNLPSSQTVVAHIAKDGHYYIHPDIKQNRSITVREAARLQSFPDDYFFEGVKEGKNRTAAFKQIGNAVPPLMASVIAKKILDNI